MLDIAISGSAELSLKWKTLAFCFVFQTFGAFVVVLAFCFFRK